MFEIAMTGTLLAVWLVAAGNEGIRAIILILRPGMNRIAGGEAVRLQSLFLEAPFTAMLQRLKLFEHFQLAFGAYHIKLVALKGASWSLERTKAEVGAGIGLGYAVLTGSAALGAFAEERLLLVMGIVVGAILAVRPFAEASRGIEERKQMIVMELPHMLSRLMLLVGAGETVQQAAARCLEGAERLQHPLYKEWSDASALMSNGQSFGAAMERFNRRCAVQEVSVFTTVVLLNYRRGGEQFVLALRELSYSLWEKRKAIARIRGEQASAKLVFPLVGILLVMMVLVGAPAVLMMG